MISRRSSFILSSTIVMLGLIAVCETVHGGTIWVDGTYTGVVSDGSEAFPYKKINDGIGAAVSGDTVKVKPSVYEESVVITKSLTLTGSGPDSTVVTGVPSSLIVIQPNLNVTVEKLSLVGSSSYGIEVKQSTSIVSIIVRNVISAGNKKGLYQLGSCTALIQITNCTFCHNSEDGLLMQGNAVRNCISTSNGGYGFRAYNPWNPEISVISSNSWNNTAGNFFRCILTDPLEVDPQYVDADTGDYRLLSSSPCRNSGDPNEVFCNPDGSRNDRGAYGGPGAAGFYDGYGSGPVVTDLYVVPGSVPLGGTFNITATGRAQ